LAEAAQLAAGRFLFCGESRRLCRLRRGSLCFFRRFLLGLLLLPVLEGSGHDY
jgi:hypothetical protein